MFMVHLLIFFSILNDKINVVFVVLLIIYYVKIFYGVEYEKKKYWF